MITFQIFVTGLLVVSVLTGLVTEAVKKVMAEHKRNYYPNTLAGIVAIALSVAIGTGYIITTNTSFTPTIITYLVALAATSWLCSMVGYDKVIQAIEQFKLYKKE